MQPKQFPTLQSLAIEVAAKNYHLYPELSNLSERVKETIIDKSIEYFDSSKTVITIAPYISQQKYWKTCLQKDKKMCNSIKLEDHGLSYKIGYLEKYFERMLESLQDYESQREHILQTARIIAPWVFTLELKINSELSIEQICKSLYNLINLKVKCSEGKNVNYKKKITGMKFAEARDLAETLRCSTNLIVLNLTGNLIDDEIFKFITPGLTLNTTLIQLNLSYNRIGDEGARKLAKFLIRNQILTHLNLCSNCIALDGSRFIAQALKLNSTLELLSLKLNALNDKAGAKFFKDLTFNTNLKVLDLQANTLGTMTTRKLCLYFQVPNSLREVYIGSNNFTESEFQVIAGCLPTQKCREGFKKSKYGEIKLQ